jgi:hypothetical protein
MFEMMIRILMAHAFLGPLVFGLLWGVGLMGSALFFIITFPPALAAGVLNAVIIFIITTATSFFHKPFRLVRCAVLGFISGGVSGYAATVLITLQMGIKADEKTQLLSIGVAAGYICGAIAAPWGIKRRAQ